ncbi:c-type cytochrome [Shimia thalassica]|uniref:c-type cytochrome n=1 Tax=Shimia thalassica TaxID=1715693 RepID=UPI002494EB90|nr:c-type cytochrome [Shimia thalassica]
MKWVSIGVGIAAGMATMAYAADATHGRDLYQEHCATCHGIDLDGNGPMSGVMIIKPSSLNDLTTQNSGVFPAERVSKRIDGRDPLVAHGSPMPVYGHFFEGPNVRYKTGSGEKLRLSRPVADLMAYLESVQK